MEVWRGRKAGQPSRWHKQGTPEEDEQPEYRVQPEDQTGSGDCVDPVRSRVQPVLAPTPERLRETPAASPGLWAASRDSTSGSERPHCARSAPSVPRAQRGCRREREWKMHLGWGKGALTAARCLSHSAKPPCWGSAGGARSGNRPAAPPLPASASAPRVRSAEGRGP